jgi:signal transduction histidine kinase
VAAAPQALEQQSLPRDARELAVRETIVESIAAVAFLATAAAIAVLAGGDRPWRWDVGIALVVAVAVTDRARFDIGAGYAPPTQLVFVPALFIAPPQYVPLIVLAGWLAGRLPELVRGRIHFSRLLVVPGNCWFTIGPALVLTLAGSHAPDWNDWPVYLLALAAQFAGDLGSGAARDTAILGAAPRIELRVLAYVWSIDMALSPIGLLAAFAGQQARFAFLGVLPLVWLLAILSRERTRRFQAELANTRAREALLAGASHELQTPLAILSGVVDTLARTPQLSEARRTASYETMARQTAHLRQLVGQFVDYARLKAGQDLLVSVRPTDVPTTLRSVADLWAQSGVVTEVQAEPVSALADPARLHRVVMTLLGNAVKYGPPEGPVTLSCRREGRRAVVEVADTGPGIAQERIEEVFDEFDTLTHRSEGSGIGLFLARTALRAQGGDVRLRNGDAGGLVATVYLPLTP